MASVTPPRSDPRRETVEFLFALVDRIRAHFETVASEADLSPAQASALLELEDPIPMYQLAGALSCDRSNVTGIIDRLEDQGLVEREVDADDRRVKNLVLTPAGIELRDRIQGRLYSELAQAAGLSAAVLDELGRILHERNVVVG